MNLKPHECLLGMVKIEMYYKAVSNIVRESCEKFFRVKVGNDLLFLWKCCNHTSLWWVVYISLLSILPCLEDYRSGTVHAKLASQLVLIYEVLAFIIISIISIALVKMEGE